MTPAIRAQLQPYGVALLVDVIALLVTWLLQPLLAPTVFALFYPAVIVSSLYGGLGPGIFASVLAGLATTYFFMPPYQMLALATPTSLFRLIVLVAIALMICGLSSRYRWAKQRLEKTVQRLRDSQDLFESFMSHSPLTAFIKDEAGRYLYVSPVVERQFNRPFAEWIGKTDFELFSPEIAQPLHDHDQTVLAAGQAMEMEEMDRQSEGNRYYMSVKFPLRDRSGNRLLAGMSLNITEWRQTQSALRETETRFSRLASTNLIGFVTWDLDGRMIDANPAFLQMVGYTDQDLQNGQVRWDVMTPPEYQAADMQAMQELWQTGVCAPFEKEYLRKDGTRISVLVGSAISESSDNQGVSFVLDLTERKRAQAALQQSEARYRLLAEALPQLVWTTDTAGQVEYCNPYWYRYTGSTPEQTLGIGWKAALQPDDLIHLWLRWQRATTTGESFQIECRVRSAQGDYRWFLAAIGPARNSDGQIDRWVGTAIEIEAIKRAEDERTTLLAREQAARAEAENERHRLREFFLKAPAMIAFVRGPDHVYEFANPTYLKVAGRSAEQLIGKPLRQAFPEIESQGFLDIFDQVYQTGVPFSGTETLVQYDRHNNGTLQTAYFNFVYQALRHPNGEVEGILMHAIDVTAQVQARRRIEELANALEAERSLLEAVLQQMPAGVIIAEAPSGKLIMGNQQVEKIWRHPFWAASEVAEYREYHGFHPDGRRYAPEEWPMARSLTTGEVVRQEEIRFLRGDGTYGIMEVNAAPVRNRQSQIMAGVVTFQDISHRKQSEQEREQLLAREQAARAEAESANRIKDEFLAVLSHELRTPLNPILGWTKLLRTRRFDAEKTAQALEVIERNATLQTQLIEDLLDISRILRGKLKLAIAPVNLATTIHAAIETIHLAAEAKSLQICTHFEPVAAVAGDAGRLQQVIWNLLSNAVKFTPAGGQVEVRLEQIAAGAADQRISGTQPEADSSPTEAFAPLSAPLYAQISVIDTGKGISSDFLPYVFEYFRQADGSTTRSFGGLGLGLAIARHLVELHGGTISATSPGEGQGATFVVRLPLMVAETESLPAENATDGAVDLTGLQVLVVDDEADSRELIRVILVERGAEVTAVGSASEALQVLEANIPSVLISDIGMPEVDGYKLMEQIKIRCQPADALPAIALTAYAGETDQQRAFAVGFQRHLAKPIEPAELVRAVKALIH